MENPNHFDLRLMPEEYYPAGAKNVPITNAPLINTSLAEIADARWIMYADWAWISGYAIGRLRIRFFDPLMPSREIRFKWSNLKFRMNGKNDVLDFISQIPMIPTFSKLYHQAHYQANVYYPSEDVAMEYYNSQRKVSRSVKKETNWDKIPSLQKIEELRNRVGAE